MSWGIREIVLGIVIAVPGVVAAYLVPALVVLALHQVGVVRKLSGHGWAAILPYYNFATTLTFYGVLLGIVLAFASRPRGRAWIKLGIRRPPIWVVVLMPPLALLLQIVTGIISELISPLLGGMKNPQGCDISQAFGAVPLLAVVSIAVIAPLVEEVVFRGFIYGGMRRRWGVTVSVLVSSALFALAHSFSVGGSILLLGPSLFIAGVALALVYERSRSLVPGMVLHASFNLIAVAAIFLVGSQASCH
ncbi:MAG TPA: type II CAAX endopeptidase family protein [Candidatus Dormibacteraeota bacterium]